MKKVFGFLKSNWLILLIIASGAFLRLYRIGDYMEFLGDQGRDVVIVRKFLQKGDLMFIGPQTSIGNMYLGPWYYYLIAPALLLSGFNPVGPAIAVALISTLAIWLFYKIVSQWFDKSSGFIAAFLFAVSPVVIYYSIFSWNPNIMPIFSLLVIYFTWQVWQEDKYKVLPFLFLSLAMVLNSHYLGLLLFPPVGLFLLLKFLKIKKDKKKKKEIIKFGLLGLLIFFVFMSPLLLFDLKHDFANFRSVWKFFTVRQTTVNLKLYKGFLSLPKLINQVLSNFIIRKDFWSLVYLLIPFILVGLWRERKRKVVKFLLVFGLTGILGLANYKQHVYAHYFGFLIPPIVVLLSISLKSLFPFTLPVLGYIFWMMVASWHGLTPANYQLDRSRKVADFIIEQSKGEEFSLALLAEQNYDPPYRYFIEERGVEPINLHEKISDQLFVICEPWGKIDCNPIGNPLWEIAAFGWAEIDEQWELEGVNVYRLIHAIEKED